MFSQNTTVEQEITEITSETAESKLDKLFDHLFYLGGGSIKVGIETPEIEEASQNPSVASESLSQRMENSSPTENTSPSLPRQIESAREKNYPISQKSDNTAKSSKDKHSEVEENELPRKRKKIMKLSTDSDDEFFNTTGPPENCQNISKKRTRQPYTNDERRKILHYIVEHDEYARVKGRDLWLIMANKKVCGSRTWQSLKEHFIKKMIYELDEYSFLSKEQRRKLKVHAFNI